MLALSRGPAHRACKCEYNDQVRTAIGAELSGVEIGLGIVHGAGKQRPKDQVRIGTRYGNVWEELRDSFALWLSISPRFRPSE
jgi:hypothetical protein